MIYFLIFGTDFTGYIPPGETKVLMMAEGIPIKEVKIHNNVAVLEPGESAISGKFALCSAVLAKKGDKVFVMHIYPKRANYTDKYIQNIIDQGIVSPEDSGRFDRVLLIGREASLHVDKFAELSNNIVQTVSLDEEKKVILICLYIMILKAQGSYLTLIYGLMKVEFEFCLIKLFQ